MSDGAGGASVADALSMLQKAMRSPGGSTTRPELRRAALRLAELVRSEDDELATFAKRHLPERSLDEDTLKELREMVIGVARLVAAQGRSPEARSLANDVRALLLPRIEEAEREPEPEAQPFSAYEPVAAAAYGSPPEAQAPASLRFAPPEAAFQPAPAPSVPPPPVMAPSFFAHTSEKAFSEPVFAPPAPQAAPPWVAPPGTTLVDDDATVDGTAMVLDEATQTYLPFRHGVAPEAFDAPIFESPPRAAETPQRTAMDGGATVGFVEPSAAGQGSTLPFRSGGAKVPSTLPEHLATIDLLSHATLNAMLSVFPDRHDWIFSQYGLRDEAERKLLDQHWLHRLSESAELMAQWIERRDYAIAHYRASY